MPRRILQALFGIRPATGLQVVPDPKAARRRWLQAKIGLVLLLTACCVAWPIASVIWSGYAGSLPTLDGTLAAPELAAAVTIERDNLGVPTLRASSRRDLAFATGFVHAQDRFFQMDLLRRHPAGELAELFGPNLVGEDTRMRQNLFRRRAHARVGTLPTAQRQLLQAYADGVEAGRRSLRSVPWEYTVLGATPAAWQPEDTLLVVYAMFHMLQGRAYTHESDRGVAHDVLPAALAAFLMSPGSRWDAPLVGGRLPARPIPDAGLIDLRHHPRRWQPRPLATASEPTVVTGSNNWAVTGSRTAHGGAIIANDMHLGLSVPSIWYRAAFSYPGEDGNSHFLCGVTLPGTPAMVVGSNRRIAWGFTNTEADHADLVLIDSDGQSSAANSYKTPDGSRTMSTVSETIHVKGGPDRTMEVTETIWGPVIDSDSQGRRRALRWTAYEPDAVNLDLMNLETASTLEEALAVAPRCGTPAQNLVVADSRGGIAWTILGRIPRRVGFGGTLPVSWADGSCRWDGYLPAKDYPRLIHCQDGILWTANNRTVGEPWLSRLGQGDYDHGARARQIRDDLSNRKGLRESDMLAIQLDDRAVFLERWQKLLLKVLSAGESHDAVANWGGRAAVDSVGFRLVRDFRLTVRDIVLSSLTAPCRKADKRFQIRSLDASNEDAIWALITEKPDHLLPPDFGSWDALLLDAAERVQQKMPPLDSKDATWGAVNTTRIRHPLSSSLGPASRWMRLDMPSEPLPGDWRAMPRIQAPSQGASQRMAVSPGHEEEGYFHLPTGQSGHPLSPHYRDQNDAWAHGKAIPFLPGPTVHTLTLAP